MQTAQLLGFDTTLVGCTNDYAQTANSDVVVITSGIPRKPGMTREELIGVNAGIVKSVAENLLKYSPNAIIVVISNPMDTMTYLALKALGLPKNRVIGMGGALDSSRFKYFLSQAIGCNANEVEGMVIGGHGDTTMIPLTRFATYKGMPVANFISAEKLEEVAAATMVGGATLTKLLGTSAWYAPGAAGAFVVESILHDQKKMVPCSVLLEGEYGESDLCIGVPVILGKNGIEKIVELNLNEDEKAKFAASAKAVHGTNAALKEVNIFISRRAIEDCISIIHNTFLHTFLNQLFSSSFGKRRPCVPLRLQFFCKMFNGTMENISQIDRLKSIFLTFSQI